jgi:hypothetical protein
MFGVLLCCFFDLYLYFVCIYYEFSVYLHYLFSISIFCFSKPQLFSMRLMRVVRVGILVSASSFLRNNDCVVKKMAVVLMLTLPQHDVSLTLTFCCQWYNKNGTAYAVRYV